MAGKKVVTAQKLQSTKRAEKIPNVDTAGKAEDAFEINEMNVVHDVVNMAFEAELKVRCIRLVGFVSPRW